MASDTAGGHDWPFTEEEIAAIKEYHSGRAKLTKFKTADEAIRWLHDRRR